MSVSIWQDDNHRLRHYPSPEIHSYDVVVIGAGIAGLSCAYHLKQQDPSLRVAVVDKGRIGEGASGRNAGFITCGSVEHFNRLCAKHGQDVAHYLWQFSEENLKLLKSHFLDKLSKSEISHLMFENHGSYSLCASDKERDELFQSAELMRERGINVRTLNSEQVETELGAKHFTGGVHYQDDASIHPYRLLELIYTKLLSLKVSFYLHHEVYSIQTHLDNRRVYSNQTVFESPLVVLTLNAYSYLMNPYFKDKIFPTRGQILATAPTSHFMKGPCYANFVLDYFRQLPTGEIIIGGFRQLQKDAEVGLSDETTPIIQEALEAFVKHHLPLAKNLPITHRWSGVMGFSVDGQPLIGTLPSDPQLAFCGGFTAHGLGLAFHSTKVLVDSLLGTGHIPEMFSARRF